MSRSFGIGGIQMSVVPWDPKATMEKFGETVKEASRAFPWIDLLVGHELSVSGLVQFVPRGSVDPLQLAEPIPGPLTDSLCELASEVRKWLMPGSMWEREDDRMYNTAVVISPEGEIVARYRKIFPWLPYEEGTAPGEKFCTFDIPDVGRFGVAICYDTWFPEVSRTLAWMGAEVILRPTMTPTADRELELIMARANAVFNQCYFIDVNGVGPWGGGRSIFVDPDGRVLQQGGEQATLLTEILDLDRVSRTREYGTLGLCQTWKQLRDNPVEFPPYRDGIASGEVLQGLGPLRFHGDIGV